MNISNTLGSTCANWTQQTEQFSFIKNLLDKKKYKEIIESRDNFWNAFRYTMSQNSNGVDPTSTLERLTITRIRDFTESLRNSFLDGMKFHLALP